MQTIKLKPLFTLVSLNKKSLRTVTSAIAINKTDTNLKSWKDIPGPSSLPLVGQLHHLLPGGQLYNIMDKNTIKNLFERYGYIVRLDSMFMKPLVYLFDAECCAQIYRSENQLPIRPVFEDLTYYRRKYKVSKGQTVRTTGLSTDQGTAWKELRSKVNQMIMQPKMIKRYTSVIDEVAQDMIVRLKSRRDEKNMIRGDFDLEMLLWAMESNGVVAFGCRLNCLDHNLPKDSPEWQLITSNKDLLRVNYDMNFRPMFWKYFPTPGFKRAMEFYENQDNLLKYFLQQGKQQLNNNTGTEKGVFQKLLEVDEETALIIVRDITTGGSDVISNSITAALYLLATNPEKQDKLREDLASNPERRPYLKACIKESQRMMSPVLGNTRLTTKDYNLLGYNIPENTQVVLVHQTMSMQEENFPRPQEFIPERWMTNKDDPLYYGNAHPFAFQPFGFGVRSCLGRRIAELEIEILMGHLIKNFKVEWVGPPPKINTIIVNLVQGPYNFIFNDV